MSVQRDRTESILNNLHILLAVGVIGAIALGYLVFFALSIAPEWRAREELAAQVSDAQRALAEARKMPTEGPAALQTRLAWAQATLTAAMQVFLTDAQVGEVLDALYQCAGASNVALADLQTQVQPGRGSQDAYRVVTVRVLARGSSERLVNYASRLKEFAAKGVVINNVTISGGEKTPTAALTLDISLYVLAAGATPIAVSPGADALVVAKPAPAPTATPLFTPTVSAEQLARRLDALWAAGDWMQVINLLEQIQALDPNYDSIADKLYAAYAIYGYQLLALGNNDQAKIMFSRALALRPQGAVLAVWQQLTGTPTPIWYPPTPLFYPTATPIPTPRYVIYVVHAGDTLNAIARWYGVPVEAIMTANGLLSYNIRIGQQLLIPVP